MKELKIRNWRWNLKSKDPKIVGNVGRKVISANVVERFGEKAIIGSRKCNIIALLK